MGEPAENEEAILLDKIDHAVVAAASLMDLVDAISEEDQEDLWDERHHCGTCMVRTVMETVWPSIEAYINYCKSKSFD